MRRAADRGDRSQIKQLRPTSIALPRLPFFVLVKTELNADRRLFQNPVHDQNNVNVK